MTNIERKRNKLQVVYSVNNCFALDDQSPRLLSCFPSHKRLLRFNDMFAVINYGVY